MIRLSKFIIERVFQAQEYNVRQSSFTHKDFKSIMPITQLLSLLTAASAPSNIMAFPAGPTRIWISWTTPSPLGDTTRYRIYYSGSNGSLNISDVLTESIGLKNGASYTMSIVGLSQHFSSENVTYTNSIPLSEFLKIVLIIATQKSHVFHTVSFRHTKCSGEFNYSNHHPYTSSGVLSVVQWIVM